MYAIKIQENCPVDSLGVCLSTVKFPQQVTKYIQQKLIQDRRQL